METLKGNRHEGLASGSIRTRRVLAQHPASNLKPHVEGRGQSAQYSHPSARINLKRS